LSCHPGFSFSLYYLILCIAALPLTEILKDAHYLREMNSISWRRGSLETGLEISHLRPGGTLIGIFDPSTHVLIPSPQYSFSDFEDLFDDDDLS
jgi:hypothetical protein